MKGVKNMYETNKKRLLYSLFENNKDETYLATDLVDNLSDDMNKATIYRQLKKLEEKKLIRKTFNEKKNSYEYQYAQKCSEHLHLKCAGCGKNIHLSCSEANSFVNHIMDNHGFIINQYSSSILGLCKECNKQ